MDHLNDWITKPVTSISDLKVADTIEYIINSIDSRLLPIISPVDVNTLRDLVVYHQRMFTRSSEVSELLGGAVIWRRKAREASAQRETLQFHIWSRTVAQFVIFMFRKVKCSLPIYSPMRPPLIVMSDCDFSNETKSIRLDH
jgi:hypothetical protein